MQPNCTYKLVDLQAFVDSASMNSDLGKRISLRGNTVRPVVFDGDGDVVQWVYGDGSIGCLAVDEWFISHSEFQYFSKVNEGYPERIEKEMELNIVVKNKEQARKAIKMLEEYLLEEYLKD